MSAISADVVAANADTAEVRQDDFYLHRRRRTWRCQSVYDGVATRD